MSSLTTSSEGENSIPRFVVGSSYDETDFLGSNMKTNETDFFEDDEEEESVRRCWYSGLEGLCTTPGSQPGFVWLLLKLGAVGTPGDVAQAVWHHCAAVLTPHAAAIPASLLAGLFQVQQQISLP